MSTVLTEFVLQMDPHGPGPSHQLVHEAWGALRGLLCAEMKRRSSWTAPPRFLGVVGYDYWTAPNNESDAVDELAAQCFEWIFVKRLDSLRQQARNRPPIDGLVVLAARQFLFETQRQNDPLGYRIFEVLRRTVRATVDAGQLLVISGDSRIRNDTVLSRQPAECAEEQRAADPSPLAKLWLHRHLEGLVTASRQELTELIECLGDDLVQWLDSNPPALRLGDLAAALKTACRSAWAARFFDSPFVADRSHPGNEETAPGVEVLRFFKGLAGCVGKSIHSAGGRAKTRTYLERLWRFLEAFATEDGDLPALAKDGADLPSHRQLAKLLDIPRERIPGLLATLGDSLSSCRQQMRSPTQENAMTPPPGSGSPPDQVHEAIRAALTQPAPTDEGDDSYGVGDIIDLAGAQVTGVHWIVLASQPGGTRYRCAPVDAYPLLGPRDLLIEGSRTDAPWVARRTFETSLSAEQLAASSRVVRLPAERLANAVSGFDAEGQQRVEETLPAYQDWIADGPGKAHQLLTSAVLPFSRPLGPRRPWTQWLAAAMAVAVAGLGVLVGRQQLDIVRLSEPILDVSYSEIHFAVRPRGDWTVEIPADATHVRIGLVLRTQPNYPSYRIEAVAPGGQVIYRTKDLEPRDSYSLTFRVEQLDGRSVSFRLFGMRDGEATQLDEEQVVLERLSAP